MTHSHNVRNANLHESCRLFLEYFIKTQNDKRITALLFFSALVYMWRPERKWHSPKWRVKDQYDPPKPKTISFTLIKLILSSLSDAMSRRNYNTSYDEVSFLPQNFRIDFSNINLLEARVTTCLHSY